MTRFIKKLKRCEICGSLIYEEPGRIDNYKKTEEGYVHLDCLHRERAQQKSNENLEEAIIHA